VDRRPKVALPRDRRRARHPGRRRAPGHRPSHPVSHRRHLAPRADAPRASRHDLPDSRATRHPLAVRSLTRLAAPSPLGPIWTARSRRSWQRRSSRPDPRRSGPPMTLAGTPVHPRGLRSPFCLLRYPTTMVSSRTSLHSGKATVVDDRSEKNAAAPSTALSDVGPLGEAEIRWHTDGRRLATRLVSGAAADGSLDRVPRHWCACPSPHLQVARHDAPQGTRAHPLA
jgi:hypothetical protein